MSMLYNFFKKAQKEVANAIPDGFLDSLVQLYDYTVLEEVKESLFYYSEKRISRDIQNYLFAINFETGTVQTCTYTKEKLEITEEYLEGIENYLLGPSTSAEERRSFRAEIQKEYTSKTLTQEIMVEGKHICKTRVYETLLDRYIYNLKEAVLDPFLENKNFRRAIRDYHEKEFKNYDRKIKNDVRYLMKKLQQRCRYTKKGAREICMYVIDKELTSKFARPK